MSNLCVLPWIHISESVSGWFKPCCNTSAHFDIPKGSNINEAFKSKELENFRKQLINGEKPSICNVCWKQEEKGIKSYRERYNKKFRYLFDKNKPQLKYFDIKFDNKCNLQCRMCNPDSSDQIWKTIKQYNKDMKLPDFLDRDFISKDTTILSYKDKKQEMFDNIDNINVFKVTGGEPFISKDFLDVMDKLIETGNSKKILLELTTNGTKFTPKYLEKFLHFRQISVNISIDGEGNTYDYIRYPFNWKLIEKRLLDFFDFVESNNLHLTKKFNVKFSTIVNSYNYLNLGSLYKRLEEYTLEYPWITWSHLRDKKYIPKIYFDFNLKPVNSCLDIKYLPKHILEEGLRDFQLKGKNYIFLNEVEQCLKNIVYDKDKIKEFVQVTLDFDKIRNQSYKTLHPMLVEFINENI